MASPDGGRSWHERPTPAPFSSIATHPARPGRVLAGLAQEGVAVSDDGGATWLRRSEGLAPGEVTAVIVAAGNPNMFYVAIRGDGLWKSEDTGKTWSLAMDRPWLDEAERDPLALASVDLETGMGGIWIYAGTEKGLTRVPDCFCRWQDVQPGNAMDALVTGDAPPAEAPLPSDEPILSLVSAPTAPSTLFAALPSGVWTSQDGGVVWAHKAKGQGRAVAVHPTDENHVVAILDGNLKLSRDGGATWTTIAVA
ncbi:exo-alpha-sialidase [Roseovarius spongiae]|uniref:Exo-alpha-sialidase n=2 Tax=Roseovarius spongiae TaxID=2320272 RepID=A0A3A8ARL9_9RHOB|nr:exo-alpha-sialidase [Roseovarius spongiae]